MDVFQVIQLCFSGSVILLGVSGNFLVLLAAYREKMLRKVPYIFVLNLSVCHLMVLLAPYLIFVIATGCGKWKFTSALCKCQAYLGYTLGMEIVTTMILISVNRYVRILKPVKYSFIFTQRSTSVMIATSWILSILGNILPLIGYGTFTLNNARDYMCALQVSSSVIQITVGGIFVFTAAVIVMFCYVRVFCAIKAHKQRVRFPEQRTITNMQSEFGIYHRESRVEDIQIAITLFLFVVIFGICWGPTLVAVLINAITGQPTSHLAGIIRVNVLVLETVLDPIAYAIRNRNFRQVLKTTCKKRSRHS